LEGHVMNDIRPCAPIQTDKLEDAEKLPEGVTAASHHPDRMQVKSFVLNAFAVLTHAGADRHVPTCGPRSPRQFQAMGPEIPVLRNKKEKSRLFSVRLGSHKLLFIIGAVPTDKPFKAFLTQGP